jgi:hypothetical protein
VTVSTPRATIANAIAITAIHSPPRLKNSPNKPLRIPTGPLSLYSIHPTTAPGAATAMALDTFFHNKIETMKLEIIQGQAKLRRLEAQRNDYNSRVRLLREELGLLQQPGSYVGEVVKVMGTKKVLVKVHPEGKYGVYHS